MPEIIQLGSEVAELAFRYFKGPNPNETLSAIRNYRGCSGGGCRRGVFHVPLVAVSIFDDPDSIERVRRDARLGGFQGSRHN
jgi:hypothetical protein